MVLKKLPRPNIFGYNYQEWVPRQQKYDIDDPGEAKIRSYRRQSHVPSIVADTKIAVSVKDMEYSHSKKGPKQIQGLNMTVKAGSMYGLTGSSGCGKTTLISCILGIKKIDAGNILLYGHNINSQQSQNILQIPGKGVGYMPQDISLYYRFTVSEMITYFGRLYGMGSYDLKKVQEELVEFLLLSKRVNAPIGKLSGGEKRRVSFAVAMVHSPMLLILDEPTVGMDPLLRDGIWRHLRKMVDNRGLSVIITTHYIEEMKCADTIGIMSNGRLIAEDSPDSLLLANNTKVLQDAIFSIYKSSENVRALPARENIGNNISSKGRDHKALAFHDEFSAKIQNHFQQLSPKSSVLRAIIAKNFKLLLRNVPLFMFFTMLPLIQLITTLFPGAPLQNVHFGVVNGELQESNMTETCPANIIGRNLTTCSVELLSCQFLDQIDTKKLSLKYFNSIEAANKTAQAGDIYGYISFSPKFSSSLITLATTPSSEDSAENTELFLDSRIITKLDKTNILHYQYIYFELFKAQEAFLSGLTGACLGNEQIGQYPIQFKDPIFGAKEQFDLSQYSAPGFMFFYAITASGFRFVEERKSGMWNRLRIAGVQLLPVLVADLVSEVFLISLQSALIVGLFVYWVPSYDLTFFAVFYTFASAMLAGYAGMSLGFVLGLLCSDQNQVAMIAVACILPKIFLSGMAWPRLSMSKWMQQITVFLPTTIPTESVRWVWSRGYGITHPKVWPGPAVLIAYILFFTIATVLAHKFKR